jgi:hypothetical protein
MLISPSVPGPDTPEIALGQGEKIAVATSRRGGGRVESLAVRWAGVACADATQMDG